MERKVFEHKVYSEDSRKLLERLLCEGWIVINATTAACTFEHEAKYYPFGIIVYILGK